MYLGVDKEASLFWGAGNIVYILLCLIVRLMCDDSLALLKSGRVITHRFVTEELYKEQTLLIPYLEVIYTCRSLASQIQDGKMSKIMNVCMIEPLLTHVM